MILFTWCYLLVTLLLATITHNMIQGLTSHQTVLVVIFALILQTALTLAYMSVPNVSSFFNRLIQVYNEPSK